MKVSKYAMNQFRNICANEERSSDEIVRYKLIRDFTLGTYIEVRGEERFVVGYGTLRIEYLKGIIVDVWRGKKSYKVNQYAKYTYNYEHGYNKEEQAV